jgi:RHH-type proline utilization regulon transcriptional repressor/proline dehydrogenase/delta 1-pyrroline-5-carboxylate dehydrogenase
MADRVITLLKGAMQELKVGDPAKLSTDIGPVINKSAQKMLMEHAEKMLKIGKLIAQVPLPKETQYGTYFAPSAYEIPSLDVLAREVFGPILHVIRYAQKDLDKVIQAINDNGYGLTLGIHTRIKSTADYILERVKVGNRYVNRNMIGAIVGVQPFGGEGLSGTGPKAGGPHYLTRLCHERSLSENTTAAGGNASLMSLVE